MFDELMLPERAELREHDGGGAELSLPLRLPWYRSLPLSCIHELALTIDGTPVDQADVSISVGDGFHSLTETKQLADTWWFTLDTAEARIRNIRVEPGEHTVGLEFTMHIPYASAPSPAASFVQTAEHSRSVRFEGGGS